MAFSNPVTGGQGALIRPAIKSPNFVAGSAGWSIDRDGGAEFNDIVIRGATSIGGTSTGTTVETQSTGNRVVIQDTIRGGQSVGEILFYDEVSTDIPGLITALGPVDGGMRSLELSAPALAGTVDIPLLVLTYDPESGVSRIFLNSTETFANATTVTDLTVTDLTAGNLQRGITSVTTVAGTWTPVAVSFPASFAAVPVVVATPQSSMPTGSTTDLKVTVSSVTVSGFTLSVFRTTAVTFNVGWIALA